MIRTIITPNTDKLTISLSIPRDYVGKELEVIAFTKDEGINDVTVGSKQVSFTILHVENRNYNFDRDEANRR